MNTAEKPENPKEVLQEASSFISKFFNNCSDDRLREMGWLLPDDEEDSRESNV